MSLVRHLRMQRAYQLLTQNGSLSIEEVANRVGYSSRSHFSSAFKSTMESSRPPAAWHGEGEQLPE